MRSGTQQAVTHGANGGEWTLSGWVAVKRLVQDGTTSVSVASTLLTLMQICTEHSHFVMIIGVCRMYYFYGEDADAGCTIAM